MRCFHVLLVHALISSVCAIIPPLTASDLEPALSEELIAQINAASPTWTAGWNSKFASLTIGQARNMLGVFPNNRRLRLPLKRTSDNNILPDEIPASFDARVQWPRCASIRHVRDQGPCGSCWCFFFHSFIRSERRFQRVFVPAASHASISQGLWRR